MASSSPFYKLPDEIVAIISGYYMSPITMSLKKDILSYLKIDELIYETPPNLREELYNKIVFWLNIQRVLQTENEMNPIQEINLLLFSSVRPKTWLNPVYKRHFYNMYNMPELSMKFYYYINNNAFTHFGENPKYCIHSKYEIKIRTIWGLFTDKERLQFLIILPYFVGVNTIHVFTENTNNDIE